MKPIQIEPAPTLDLRSNTTAQPFLTKDVNYFYYDSYINNCLGHIESCQNGFTVVFNLSLANDEAAAASKYLDTSYSNGRTVLASSGGDSAFSNGGFYLHQVNVRKDRYLEVGVSIRKDLYSTRLYLDTVNNAKLAVSWNQKGMTVFVDGVFYKSVSTPVNRSYYNLNYNAFKRYFLKIFLIFDCILKYKEDICFVFFNINLIYPKRISLRFNVKIINNRRS